MVGADYFDAVINETISFPPQWDVNTADFIRSVSGCSKYNYLVNILHLVFTFAVAL